MEQKKPFHYFNRLYLIAGGARQELYEDNHLLWVDYLLDQYLKYESSGFTCEESQVNSVMDGLEALINGAYNNRLFPCVEDD